MPSISAAINCVTMQGCAAAVDLSTAYLKIPMPALIDVSESAAFMTPDHLPPFSGSADVSMWCGRRGAAFVPGHVGP